MHDDHSDDSDTPSDTSDATSVASAGPALTAAAKAAVDKAIGAAVKQAEAEEKTPAPGLGGSLGLGLDSQSEGEESAGSVSEEEAEKENSQDWRGCFVPPSPVHTSPIGASWQSLSGEVAAARAHSELSVLEAPEVLTFNRADVVDVTQEVPVIHTEMKTVTYQSLEADADPEAGVLMSAQTITSDTTSTTTTTHITKVFTT
ncbi:unnamed protein product [Oncorhynchus mykiss]|uniref:Band 4.1 C-terminal domain-containing protein n=1 Tax=Oncorhynchus mykiss TaxID=8022 RepID=A0A060YPM8_ONCMY|nr:unnamed protein product [Oncorhynchus mykiss]